MAIKESVENGQKIIEIEEECSYCNGTGLFNGMAERDGFAVVCNQCKGTGKYIFKHSYKDFTERKDSSAKYVIKANPGICVGLGDGKYKPEDFGAISYQDWKDKKEFPEMRKFTCPRWWNQVAESVGEPNWKECDESWGWSFSQCPSFHAKDKCWKKWDTEKKN